MNNIDIIKEKVNKLFLSKSNIHINIKNNRPKVAINNLEVTIKGIYPNIFCVTETNGDTPKSYSFQYVDVLIGRVEILELTK